MSKLCHFLHSHSQTLQYIWQAQDHIRTIQRLQATGFSVSPITPFPFTRAVDAPDQVVYLKTFCDSRMRSETLLSEGQVVTSCH